MPERLKQYRHRQPRGCRHWFEAAAEFCERYDENCFDPGYDWLPLEHFAPAVEKVFSREPAFR